MKNFGGCSAPMGLAVLALVLGLFGAGYWLVTYIDQEMGSNGVFFFLGILIGIPVLVIVLVLVFGYTLMTANTNARMASSNDELMQGMLSTTSKIIMLAKSGGRSASEPAQPVDGWNVLPPPTDDPVKRLTASPSWDTQTQTQNSNRMIVES